MSTPQSEINICSGVRLDNRYEHTIYFPDVSSQRSYFAGKVVKTFSAYSYLRKTWPLQVQATMEQAKKWSYLFFRNSSDGKTYYYFITQIEWRNENMVELALELDVLQTYFFDWKRLQCFVEREHSTTDNPTDYTLEEGLELGDPVDNAVYNWTDLNESCILVLSTINPNNAVTETPTPALSGMYNGVFSGLKVWAVNSLHWAAWGNQLDDLSASGYLDGIIAMWMYPKSLVKLGGENTWSDSDICKTVDAASVVGSLLPFDAPPTTVDGYTPRNKKLLTYPYSYLYVSNNMGGSAVYRWERFDNYESPTFKAHGTLSPEGTVKIHPLNYNGVASNYEHGLSLGSFPSCAWDADVYKMWLAQNQNQHQLATNTSVLKVAGGVVAGVAGLATGNLMAAGGGAMTAVSGAQQIAGLLAQKADMEIQPPQARGSFSSNVNMTAGLHTFSFYRKSIDAEHARIIDDYFTMYGYKVNRVKTPAIRARENFTYVKTVGCKIQSDMCIEDVVKIENIFDHGITFWVNGDRIGDYSQSNNPIT